MACRARTAVQCLVQASLAAVLLLACCSSGHVSTSSLLTSGPGSSHSCGFSHVQNIVKANLEAAVAEAASRPPQLVAEASSSSGPAPIRISIDFQTDGLTAAEAAILKEAVSRSVNVLRKFVMVNNPLTGPLVTKNKQSCGVGGGAIIPDKVKAPNSGYVDTDLLILATLRDIGPCISAAQVANGEGGPIAFATACDYALNQLDNSGRPIISTINLCKSYFIDSVQTLGMDRQLDTPVHELLHSLGLAGQYYDVLYPAPAGQQSALKYSSFQGGSSVPWLVGKKSQEVAAKYFRCSSVPGAPLEDSDGASHFEFRLLPSEMMGPVGINAVTAIMSEFTLAALEDSGWYTPRWDYVQPYPQPLQPTDLGCDLVGMTCPQYTKKYPSQQYFCVPDNAKSSADVQKNFYGFATCLPSLNDQSTMQCIYADGFSNTCTGTYAPEPATCALAGINLPANPTYNNIPGYRRSGLFYGPGHKCSMTTSSSGRKSAGCFDFRCDSAGTSADLYELCSSTASSGSLCKTSCPAGQSVQPSSFTGKTWYQDTAFSITCPANSEVCPADTAGSPCGPNGWLQGGKCVCRTEYVGTKCETNVANLSDTELARLNPSPTPSPSPSPTPAKKKPPPTPKGKVACKVSVVSPGQTWNATSPAKTFNSAGHTCIGRKVIPTAVARAATRIDIMCTCTNLAKGNTCYSLANTYIFNIFANPDIYGPVQGYFAPEECKGNVCSFPISIPADFLTASNLYSVDICSCAEGRKGTIISACTDAMGL